MVMESCIIRDAFQKEFVELSKALVVQCTVRSTLYPETFRSQHNVFGMIR